MSSYNIKGFRLKGKVKTILKESYAVELSDGQIIQKNRHTNYHLKKIEDFEDLGIKDRIIESHSDYYLKFREDGYLSHQKAFDEFGEVGQEHEYTFDKDFNLIKIHSLDPDRSGKPFNYTQEFILNENSDIIKTLMYHNAKLFSQTIYQYSYNNNLLEIIEINNKKETKVTHRNYYNEKNQLIKSDYFGFEKQIDFEYNNENNSVIRKEVDRKRNETITERISKNLDGKNEVIYREIYCWNKRFIQVENYQYDNSGNLQRFHFRGNYPSKYEEIEKDYLIFYIYDKEGRLIETRQQSINDNQLTDTAIDIIISQYYSEDRLIEKRYIKDSNTMISSFDKFGQLIERKYIDYFENETNVKTTIKDFFKYEYDEFHNWIKMTHYKNNIPVFASKREITYY